MAIKADYHIHTHHSEDSTAPMEDMIKQAISKGLSEICFTEHMDLDFPDYPDMPPHPFILNPLPYREEYLKYRDIYSGRIALKFGVEIGMQTHVAKENTDFIRRNDFDFVIGSIHLIDNKDPYYPDFWDNASVDERIKRYFKTTLENIIEFNDFDVLGHLDYITRYAPKTDNVYTYDKYSDLIDPILVYLIDEGKGLDCNSQMLSKDISFDPNPSPAIISRFRQLGGEIITFGSDAHRPDVIACGFDKMRDIALSCGFTGYYTFEKRKPIFHSL